ncbi:hypothetical protein [Oligoflexus tunisiensis]|uniref:hypothetical protein n=1 Tax=Oligoflexus tunisiensis TaxID=708132 RepID=UPI00114CC3B5|nr:hypothetical protein [Oligoflexus tunisiensis]
MLPLVVALWACNANPALDRAPDSTEGQPPPAEIRDFAPTADSIATPAETPATITESEEDAVALEPIAIGGAFLACRYPDNQKQGEAAYRMDCTLTPEEPITVTSVSASFRKIDGQGQSYNLTVTSQNMAELSWVLSETPDTLFYRIVEATISVNGSAPTVFRAELNSTMTMQRVATYWLGGEPNNELGPNGEDEDCAEYENLAGKNNHASVTGLSSGPLGRFNDTICTLTDRNFLCKNITDRVRPKWAVSAGQGPFSANVNACPQGYRFALPMSEAEMMEVNTLIDQRPGLLKMWVPLSDAVKEGDFRISF